MSQMKNAIDYLQVKIETENQVIKSNQAAAGRYAKYIVERPEQAPYESQLLNNTVEEIKCATQRLVLLQTIQRDLETYLKIEGNTPVHQDDCPTCGRDVTF